MRHVSRRIQLVGFVSRDDRFGGNSFYLGRMLVWCCAADAMPVGLYCDPGSSARPKQGQWLSVTGTVEAWTTRLPGWKHPGPVPALVDLRMEPIPPPESPYVYTLSW
jgi:putative membrane protein